MNNSSAQENYYTTLTDEQLSALTTTDTITLTSGGSSYYNMCDTYTTINCHTPTYTSGSSTITFTGGTTSTSSYTIGNISGLTSVDISSIKINLPIEWVSCFPEWTRVEKMCEEYPALKIAFDKFKTTYKLVQDDYDAPPHKKIKP